MVWPYPCIRIFLFSFVWFCDSRCGSMSRHISLRCSHFVRNNWQFSGLAVESRVRWRFWQALGLCFGNSRAFDFVWNAGGCRTFFLVTILGFRCGDFFSFGDVCNDKETRYSSSKKNNLRISNRNFFFNYYRYWLNPNSTFINRMICKNCLRS